MTAIGALAVDNDFSFKGSFDKESERANSAPLLSFSQVPTTGNEYSCRADGITGSVFKVEQGGKVSSFIAGGTGGSCGNGQFIRYYLCEDGKSCKQKKDIFAHLWYKSDSNDVIDFTKYQDTSNWNDFYATYSCYSCDVQGEPESSYTCFNAQWRGEPGTQYEGLNGVCINGCKTDTSGLKSKDVPLIQSALCSTKTQTTQAGSNSAGNQAQTKQNNEMTGSNSLKGEFTRVNLPGRIEVGEFYNVEAVFTASTAGEYYLEAGTTEQKQALAVVNAEASKCDNDQHWAGEYVALNAGDSVTMNYKLLGREEAGKYNFIVGAYTGCLKNGGQEISVSSQIVDVYDQGKYCDALTNCATTSWTLLLYLIEAIALIAGILMIRYGMIYYGIGIIILDLILFIITL